MIRKFSLAAFVFFTLMIPQIAPAQNERDLFITREGKTTASVIVAKDAGIWEKQAAADLVKYIEMMSGAKPRVFDDTMAFRIDTPLIYIGKASLNFDAGLQQELARVQKKNPVVRADAIVMRRVGNRVLLAGSNDESHYFAVAQLLQNWGVRWYAPTDFGECVPVKPTLQIGKLNMAYAPPFEIRRAWNRGGEGVEEWNLRNFMSSANAMGAMGALSGLTADIAPQGKTVYQVPFAEKATAQHVVEKIEARYAKGESDISLAAFIGEYSSDSFRDKELSAGIKTKYTNMISSSDAMLELYNNVAKILHAKYPNSKSRLIGIAFAGVTLPPQRAFKPQPNLVMWLVPADFDPIHAMNDARSPSRQEYGAIAKRWAQVMQGRVAIYDYLEPMLVWRDLPNPSHLAFASDIKQFRDAGVLGFSPEPRGSLSINFLEIYLRGQLMWNPDADTEKLLAEFYLKFYGPAAAPMRDYWNAIFAAWNRTLVTEHEYFVAPAIYTPELLAKLRTHLEKAQATVLLLKTKDPNYLQRMNLARISFDILDHYAAMVRAGATDADYEAAAQAGTQGLASVLELAKFNPSWTPNTNANSAVLESGGGPAQWAGEVQQMKELAALTNGAKGNLISRTPLEWAFHRDPHDSGLARGWGYAPVDLTYWNANKAKLTPENRKDYPTTQWEMLRTDLYAQAQGVRHPDGQSFNGFYWYQTQLQLKPEDIKGKVHLMFPGLFNECWLYVNGVLVAHRNYSEPWWQNDYRFEWDVSLDKVLQPGVNQITVRGYNPRNMGGIFRRPFLYRANG